MADSNTAKTTLEAAVDAALAKAADAGLNYIYLPVVTENGEPITSAHEVAARFLDQNRYLYCDNTDAEIDVLKQAHPEAIPTGFIVYDGDEPEFITNADKWVDNNIDVFMRAGHYDSDGKFIQKPFPSYIDSEEYDTSDYDTNGDETAPLYDVSDEIILEDE